MAASIPEEYEEVEIVKKSVELKQRTATGRVYKGSDCEYIKLGSVTVNDGCTDGNKFVIKQVSGVRKQFLILNGEVVLAFVTKGKKFTACTSYTEVTTSVDCKVVSGLSDVDLSASSGNNTTTAAAAAQTTTAAAAADTTTAAAAAADTTAAAAADTTTAAAAADTTTAAPTTTATAAETTTAAASADTTTASGATTTAAGCKCGKKRTSRIVGGSETEINEYPWMAVIATTAESQFCGGSLIGTQWVITATHCMFKDQAQTQPQTAADIVVVLGEHDLFDENESKLPRKVVKVSQIIKHESYDKVTSNNDIALLKLAEEVDLNTYTPVCLPKTADNGKYDGKNAWVYGWGTTSYGGASASKLLEVEVPVVTNAVCKEAMPQYTITDAMLCAGGQLNKDGCQGDSGGPLTVDDNGKHVLIGDVSFGNKCGLEGQYGVYGDVAYFRTWLDTNMANNGGVKYCPA